MRVHADTPLRRGYLEAMGGATSLGGPFLRGELGYRPRHDLAFYGAAEWNQIDPWAGVGLRWTF